MSSARTTYGQPVTLTASVAPAPGASSPQGTVEFRDGTTKIGEVTLTPSCPGIVILGCLGGSVGTSGGLIYPNASTGSFTTAALHGGGHTLTAVYLGGPSSSPSTSMPVTLQVDPAPTTLAAQPAVIRFNPFTLNLLKLVATLKVASSGAPLAGHSVVFKAGATTVCTATTDSTGTATCSGLGGLLAILLNNGYTATFSGTPDYKTSTAGTGLVS